MNVPAIKHSKRILRVRLIRSYTQSSPSHTESDVVIVGGGPVGLTLASVLGSSFGLGEKSRISLIEAGDLDQISQWSPTASQYSNRVSSITNASRKLLQDSGSWQHVDQSRTCPIEEMQVWDGISDARITFHSSDMPKSSAISSMATLTENLNLQRGILRHLRSLPHVKLYDKVKVTSISKESGSSNDWPLLTLSNNRTIRTKLLIGADGFNSPVREFAGISSYGWAYDTHGVVATLSHHPKSIHESPNNTAYQRFLPTGPIAFLPLHNTVSSLVWSTKPSIAAVLCKMNPDVLALLINAAFRLPEVSVRYLQNFILEVGPSVTASQLMSEIKFREDSHRFDQYSAYSSSSTSATDEIPLLDSGSLPPVITAVQPGTVGSFPLRYNHASSYVGEGEGSRTVLVGDAAHTVHPLAGQGLNLGLADVECLARCLRNVGDLGGDIGSYTALQPYARERYISNHTLMSAVDKLHKLYGSTNASVVWARSVGLEVLNEFDSIKAAIMMDAGATATGSKNAQLAWERAGMTLQNLTTAWGTARFLGQGVMAAAQSTMMNLLRGSRGM